MASMNVMIVMVLVVVEMALVECECKWPSLVLSVVSTVTVPLPSFL